MIYFKVGNTDYSSHITGEKDYAVEEKEITYDWTDGFGGTHKNVYNTKIEGSFDMFFATQTAYTAFLTALNNAKSHGALPCIIYVRNKHEEIETHVYYSTTVKKFSNLIDNKVGFVVTIKVEEAAVYA